MDETKVNIAAWEETETLEEKPTWKHFTQNTTFHGIRYIFGSHSFLRKAFWILVILGCMTFFISQVALRVLEYYRYESISSITMETEDTLPFPAVTLCNLNQFRITKADELGIFTYLDDLFNPNKQLTEHDAGQLKVAHTSLVIDELGHPLDDLVDGCWWKGMPCDMKLDFVTRQMDVGLCHTFNFNSSAQKSSYLPGVDGGLRLLLNIESYEHMRGQNMDSGVKILLHNPDDQPMLRNQGFVATPGHHTLAAISMKNGRKLPHPYGDCILSGESVANCLHNCIAEKYLEHCGCVAPYMNKIDVDTLVSPVGLCERNCSCPSPCTTTSYHTQRSSAMLSPTNLDSISLQKPGKLERTNRSFLAASEVQLWKSGRRQRNFDFPAREIIKYYHIIDDIDTNYWSEWKYSLINLLEEVSGGLGRAYTHLRPATLKSQVDQQISCPDPIKALDRAVKAVKSLGNEILDDWPRVSGRLCDERFWNNTYNACEDSFLLSPASPEGSYALADQESSSSSENIPDINLNPNKKFVSDVCGLISYILGADDYFAGFNLSDYYKTEILGSFIGTSDETDNRFDRVPQHKKSLEAAEYLIDYLHNISEFMWELELSQFECNNLSSIIHQLDPAKETRAALIFETFKSISVEETFCWPEEYTPHDAPKIESQIPLYDEASFLYTTLGIKEFDAKVLSLLEHSLGDHLLDTNDTMNDLKSYVDGKLTTRELAVKLAEPSIFRHIGNLISDGEMSLEYISYLSTNILRLQDISALLDIMTNKMVVPLARKDNAGLVIIEEMIEELKLGRPDYIDDQCLNYTADYHVTEVFDTLNKVLCSAYQRLEVDSKDLSNALREMETKLNYLYDDLSDYIEDTEMNEAFYKTNFILVDMYFERLQYELQTEQRAFVLGSLFSEIGGFLGLLLGASVLTMCEIIDHILLCLQHKLSKNRVTTKQ